MSENYLKTKFNSTFRKYYVQVDAKMNAVIVWKAGDLGLRWFFASITSMVLLATICGCTYLLVMVDGFFALTVFLLGFSLALLPLSGIGNNHVSCYVTGGSSAEGKNFLHLAQKYGVQQGQFERRWAWNTDCLSPSSFPVSERDIRATMRKPCWFIKPSRHLDRQVEKMLREMRYSPNALGGTKQMGEQQEKAQAEVEFHKYLSQV